MDSLLRWGIENSTPPVAGAPAAPVRRDLDPAIVDHILGKPDAVLMKETLEIAVDRDQSEDERVEALDNLEMLIENIDNANDLSRLQMWRPLQDLLASPDFTPAIVTQVLWVIGTALQNNPAAQTSYLSLEPIPTLISYIQPQTTSGSTRSKAIYALSGLLKHNAVALKLFGDAGWSALRVALEDSEIAVRRKVVFLINTLLLSTHEPTDPLSTSVAATGPQIVHPNSHASMLSDPNSASTSGIALEALQSSGTLDGIISGLVDFVPFGADGDGDEDLQFEETCIRILYTYAVTCQAALTEEQKEKVAIFITEQEYKQKDGDGRWGLVTEEYSDLKGKLGFSTS